MAFWVDKADGISTTVQLSLANPTIDLTRDGTREIIAASSPYIEQPHVDCHPAIDTSANAVSDINKGIRLHTASSENQTQRLGAPENTYEHHLKLRPEIEAEMEEKKQRRQELQENESSSTMEGITQCQCRCEEKEEEMVSRLRIAISSKGPDSRFVSCIAACVFRRSI